MGQCNIGFIKVQYSKQKAAKVNVNHVIFKVIFEGVETGSTHVQYIQGIQPNVPPCTTFIE